MLRARIRRPRLLGKLDAAAQRPVTIISAGAGWGKTVLASSWADTRPVPIGWLTVDDRDNDAQVFWSYVVEALRRGRAVGKGNPLADLGVAPRDSTQRTRYLTRGFHRLSASTVLILDDFHEIEDPKVIDELSLLLRHPPPRLSLILITRAEPALPLHRLRASGALTEIGAPDLAFTADEAAELLARYGLTPAPDDITTLLDRAEGWPAGMQLAGAFLTAPGGRRTIADFTGDVQPVDEYLAHEVLATQPPYLLRFLFWTSICDHVCGDLADAITLRADGQRTLEELERVNGFVFRLGSRPKWYRYHGLLRDVLRHRLMTELPTIVPRLHRRAARWYAAQHLILEALNHAVAAQDWDYVARLVVTHAGPLVLSSSRSAIMRVLRQVPTEELSSSADLLVCAGFRLFDAGDFDALSERLAIARRKLPDTPDEDRVSTELAIRVLQVSVDRVVGDMPALVTETTQLLAMLPKVLFTGVPSVLQYRAIALNNKGVGLLWTGRPDQAERYLWTASTAAHASGVELIEINALGHLALLEAMRGRLKESARLAADAIDLAERRGWLEVRQAVPAQLALALVGFERNELAEAQRLLAQALRANREPEAIQRLIGLGAQAWLALAHGDPTRARALLEEAQRQTDPRMLAPAVDRWLSLAESEVDLATGGFERVEARYSDLAAGHLATFPEQVCRARAAFAMRDLDRAESLLAATPRPMSETLAGVQASILTALVADARGHGLEAVEALAKAFALAEPEGIRTPFIAMGGGRLEGLISRQSLLTQRNAAFTADVRDTMKAATEGRQPSYPTGELSLRETEVLHYLPTMLTAGEIATELGVSINTVKAHMRSIYRKLDVGRRREAVVRAHEHRLL
jgi:LuxR family maltose regulon positive regulatory protein